MAARPKAAGSGMDGIIQWMAYPTANTVTNTSPTAISRIGARSRHSSSLGVCLPSLYNSGAMNKTKNNSGSSSKCTPEGIIANSAPRAI
ncbi:hypothetical protein D3C81_2128130 [compost metagenome]